MAPEFAREKAPDMFQAKPLGFAVSNTPKRGFSMAQTMVRVFAVVFTLAAICVMATSSQTVVLFGFTIKAHYTYSSAMRFLFVTDAIVAASSVLSLILPYYSRRSGSNPNYFYLFLHDMVIMVLAISGCAASTAVAYIGRYGEEKMGWMAICNRVSKFCNHMTLAMVLSYLAFFSYFALAVMSSNKVMYQANDE